MSTAMVVVLLAFLLALAWAMVLEGWRGAIVRAGAADDGPPSATGVALVSLVVPARNAATTLTPLLQDLHAQRFPKDRCEVLVVDDGSTDGTADTVRRMMRTWPQLRLVALEEGRGKKAAIVKGVSEAKGELVLLTDADARCGRDRVARLVERWVEERPDLVLMPVRTAGGNGAAAWLQRKEQAALQGAMLGSGVAGSPVLASGANMAFTRETFLRIGGYNGDRWASGDDMFLLRRMRRNRRQVSFLAHPDVVVRVSPEPGWRGFFAQRLRWAGKMRAYGDAPGLVAAAAAVLFPWALLAITLGVVRHVDIGLALFDHGLPLVAAWSLWLFPVLRLTGAMERYFVVSEQVPPGGAPLREKGGGWVFTPPALLAFLLYGPVIAVLSNFVRPKWKGRRV